MKTIYHAQVTDDKTARKLVATHLSTAEAFGGSLNASFAAGAGPTILVLVLTDEHQPNDVIQGYEWEKAGEESA